MERGKKPSTGALIVGRTFVLRPASKHSTQNWNSKLTKKKKKKKTIKKDP
jgi:hypothetical protein